MNTENDFISKKRCLSFLEYDRQDDLSFFDEKFNYEANHSNNIMLQNSADILVQIANLDNEHSLATAENIIRANANYKDIDNFCLQAHSALSSCFGEDVAYLLTLNMFNENENLPANERASSIMSDIEHASALASTFCHGISDDYANHQNGSRIASVISALSSTFPPDILYRPTPAFSKSSGEIIYCNCFSASSITDALYLCFVLTVREKRQIRCCKVCGKYFTPAAKSNEIYCGDCRKTTYDTKIKDDEILRTYRTVYKTQNARKQRNSHRPNITDKFEQWKRAAKLKLVQCQNNEITLEEMKQSISSDDWLSY